jgi:hypothetical protein
MNRTSITTALAAMALGLSLAANAQAPELRGQPDANAQASEGIPGRQTNDPKAASDVDGTAKESPVLPAAGAAEAQAVPDEARDGIPGRQSNDPKATSDTGRAEAGTEDASTAEPARPSAAPDALREPEAKRTIAPLPDMESPTPDDTSKPASGAGSAGV